MNDEGLDIVINFDSCWQNGFLNDEDGLEEKRKKLVPRVRGFFATSKSDKSTDKDLTKNTVLGVLCRLIGDQRKLYQSRSADDYYFKDMEQAITFSYNAERKNFSETVVVINKSDNRAAQSAYLGVVPDDCQLFSSTYAKNLWHVLDLSIDEVCDHINDEKVIFSQLGETSLNHILNRIREIGDSDRNPKIELIEDAKKAISSKLSNLEDELKAIDANDKKNQRQLTQKTKIIEDLRRQLTELQNNQTLINIDNKIKKAISKYPKLLGKKGDEDDGKNKIKGVYPMALYGAALYLNARKLKDEKLANFLSDDNKLSGFAEEFFGFNGIRDFLNPLAGGRKKTVKTPAFINKHSGKLIINVKPPIDTEDLVQRIENACVSSFYLGKKGLAYVQDIRI